MMVCNGIAHFVLSTCACGQYLHRRDGFANVYLPEWALYIGLSNEVTHLVDEYIFSVPSKSQETHNRA
jgi:hypothetical protein